ncbi:MAG: hypothetical protein EWV61_21560 [Microcystis aeruginosa Ma_AC_P_19900807_S300]|uniref:Uncharacterized protein n=1 Tax=Microcystis aeruginosa DA14 TaxID=1987506 RepID=A0A3E0M9G7_MICAE|nr:MAG: hypothetical protein DWQ56_12035 [Microcystis aeruginosa DA14]TRT95844.1 MAG: hypothetical protein EWV61_21560 [Microcystis aeruginosa Ma_AC_P_19900807_S300]
MRNVNLNILKFLESINNFCLSLTHIGLGVRSQESVAGRQETVFSESGDYFIYSSHTPHPLSSQYSPSRETVFRR